MSEPTKNDGEQDHGHGGLKQGPRHPGNGLAVANSNIAPSEKHQQVAVVPEIAPEAVVGFAGRQHQHMGFFVKGFHHHAVCAVDGTCGAGNGRATDRFCPEGAGGRCRGRRSAPEAA